jgi:hypothetical protein
MLGLRCMCIRRVASFKIIGPRPLVPYLSGFPLGCESDAPGYRGSEQRRYAKPNGNQATPRWAVNGVDDSYRHSREARHEGNERPGRPLSPQSKQSGSNAEDRRACQYLNQNSVFLTDPGARDRSNEGGPQDQGERGQRPRRWSLGWAARTVAFGECDDLAGPPNTMSRWASQFESPFLVARVVPNNVFLQR